MQKQKKNEMSFEDDDSRLQMENIAVVSEKHVRHLDAIDYNAGGLRCIEL